MSSVFDFNAKEKKEEIMPHTELLNNQHDVVLYVVIENDHALRIQLT